MKKYFFIVLSLLCLQCVKAQVNLKSNSGTYIVAGGHVNFVMDSGNYSNNGIYIDTTGTFIASGGITFSGSGYQFSQLQYQ
jgi:hypothetical protein